MTRAMRAPFGTLGGRQIRMCRGCGHVHIHYVDSRLIARSMYDFYVSEAIFPATVDAARWTVAQRRAQPRPHGSHGHATAGAPPVPTAHAPTVYAAPSPPACLADKGFGFRPSKALFAFRWPNAEPFVCPMASIRTLCGAEPHARVQPAATHGRRTPQPAHRARPPQPARRSRAPAHRALKQKKLLERKPSFINIRIATCHTYALSSISARRAAQSARRR